MTPRTEVEAVPGSEDIRFAASVKRRREALGWSQGELARLLKGAGLSGFHQTTISRIEKCERLVRLGEAKVIADTLQTRLDVMFLEAGEMETLVRFTEAVKSRRKTTSAISHAVQDFLEAQAEVDEHLESVAVMKKEEEALSQKIHLDSLIREGRTFLALDPVEIAMKAAEKYHGQHSKEG
ncbi:helix-turn-helix transcriptional regulator [Arthrobacter sp. G119Y2]|uniref:helix-turn-helix transcriptional regulator n=1 Tax=Arthrobacter sp. G119Y2 TaxID=3134965 RepID=UPI00311A4635